MHPGSSKLPEFRGAKTPICFGDLDSFFEQAKSITNRSSVEDDQASGDSGSDDDSDEESLARIQDFWEVAKNLQIQTSHLARIGPTIQRVSARLKKDELESISVYPPIVPFQVSNAAGVYVSLIRDKFKNATNDLVERLGEANGQRHQNVRNQFTLAESASEAIFRPVSVFHDSGLGTSVPNESEYARSHTSFLSTDTNGALGDLRVPANPSEVQQGKPFECFICKKIVGHIKNRVDWKYANPIPSKLKMRLLLMILRIHVFADIRPYICTFPGCTEELAQFSSRTDWGDHEFNHHRVNRTWRCPDCPVTTSSSEDNEDHAHSSHGRQKAAVNWQTATRWALDARTNPAEHERCPLCFITPGSSRRVFVNHVARHMEQISLLALPRDETGSDEEAESNGSEPLDEITNSEGITEILSGREGSLKVPKIAENTTEEHMPRVLEPPPFGPLPLPAKPLPSRSWSFDDDTLLIQKRSEGLDWGTIASDFFPQTKTPNACRKRHERLVKNRKSQERSLYLQNRSNRPKKEKITDDNDTNLDDSEMPAQQHRKPPKDPKARRSLGGYFGDLARSTRRAGERGAS